MATKAGSILSKFWEQKMNPSHCRNWYCVPKTPIRNYLWVLGTVIAPWSNVCIPTYVGCVTWSHTWSAVSHKIVGKAVILLRPVKKLIFRRADVSGKKVNSFLLWFVLIPKLYLFLPIRWFLVPAGVSATPYITHHKHKDLSFFPSHDFAAQYIWQGGT